MKRLTKAVYIILALFFLTYSSAFAQDEDDIESVDLGVGLAYGSEIENLGINANAYFPISDVFLVGGGLTYYFPDDTPGATTNWFAINLNGQYLFYSEENFNAYGLAGLNILIQSINFDEAVAAEDLSETYLGLNIGAGIEYGLGNADLFGELKMAGIGGDLDQLVLSAGIRFNL